MVYDEEVEKGTEVLNPCPEKFFPNLFTSFEFFFIVFLQDIEQNIWEWTHVMLARTVLENDKYAAFNSRQWCWCTLHSAGL